MNLYEFELFWVYLMCRLILTTPFFHLETSPLNLLLLFNGS
jgi:hypothetical protein